MRRRIWMLLSATAFFVGAIMPSICAALCQADICTPKEPATHTCCKKPEDETSKCGSCDRQAELTAKKGPLTSFVCLAWDAPPAVLPAFEPIQFLDRSESPSVSIHAPRGREPPPDPVLARCLRSPPGLDA